MRPMTPGDCYVEAQRLLRCADEEYADDRSEYATLLVAEAQVFATLATARDAYRDVEYAARVNTNRSAPDAG